MIDKTMREEMLSSLRQVRQLLEKGWCRRVFAEDASGAAVNETDASACRWCLAGAVHRVCEENHSLGLRSHLHSALRQTIDDIHRNEDWTHIPFFNDAQDSVEPVIAVVDATIARLEQDGDAGDKRSSGLQDFNDQAAPDSACKLLADLIDQWEDSKDV